MVVIIIIVLVVVPVAILWVRGIDYMQKNHPDYKGEEFLNWDRKNDDWDDNKIHSEGDF